MENNEIKEIAKKAIWEISDWERLPMQLIQVKNYLTFFRVEFLDGRIEIKQFLIYQYRKNNTITVPILDNKFLINSLIKNLKKALKFGLEETNIFSGEKRPLLKISKIFNY